MKIILVIFLSVSTSFANWGLWVSERSDAKLNINGTTNSYSLWDDGVGTFHGSDLGAFTNGDILEINSIVGRTWKNQNSTVTGNDYFYVIYETGARPSSPSFISLNGGLLTDLDNGNQEWGANGLHVNLLSGLEPNKSYTLEVYGYVDGNNQGEQTERKYDDNNGSITHYTATFTTDASLPVELLNFISSVENSEVNLIWETAT